MDFWTNMKLSMGWLRGNEIPSNPIAGPDTTQGSVLPPVHNGVENSAEKDHANEEREARLESWMEEVKAFIRSIDVHKL